MIQVRMRKSTPRSVPIERVSKHDGVVRRNFALNVLDGALFTLGINLVSRQAVLPLLVTQIGGGAIAVSLITVLWTVGFYLPQFLIAGRVGREPRKKRLMLRTAVAQRLPWLCMALLAAFGLERVSADVGLISFFAVFGLAAVMGSLSVPVWFEMVAKLTPVRLRGRMFGLRVIFSGLFGMGAGWAAEFILERMAYPDSFALLFVLAFVMMIGSYVCLALLEENEDAPTDGVSYADIVRRIPSILRHEPNFRNFLVADALLMASLSAEAFYAVHAFERFGLSSGFAGRFTAVLMASSVIGSVVFGYLGDRIGHRLNLALMGASTALACTVAVLAPSAEAYYLVFVGASFATTLQLISRLPIVAEICGERDRPIYLALANIVSSPFALCGLLAGWLAQSAGYTPVFLVLGGMALCALLWLLLFVREPRTIA